MLFSSRAEEKVRGKIACSSSCTLEVFIRIQLFESHTKKIERKSAEFSKTASQNADHVLPFNSSLLVRPPYPSPSLRFSYIDMAMLNRAKGDLAVTSKRLIVVVAVPNHVLKVQKGEWQKRVTRRIKS